MNTKQLNLFGDNKTSKVINVSSVPQRSPFRYAGGKTWLIPTIRKWLSTNEDKTLIEPFCGGGIVSLTASAERLANNIIMVEIDDDVAAVWEVILSNHQYLIDKILGFEMNRENVSRLLNNELNTLEERAFATIIRNRTNHGGILTKGAGVLKNGENGKGISSRWYPNTLVKRIQDIVINKDNITFIKGDAFDFFNNNYYNDNTYFFIDPPYTVAGKRLYTHNDVNHDELFRRISLMNSHYLVTYDKSDFVISLIEKYSLKWKTIPMTTTHHVMKDEILISDNFDWFE